MLLLKIDEKSRKPIYMQIIEQVREKIEKGSLQPGDKLPSTRQMAEKLGIHRTTVATAYQELWTLGYIELKPGCCPWVRVRVEMAGLKNKTEKGCIDWSSIASPGSNEIWKMYADSCKTEKRPADLSVIDLGSMDIDSRLFPMESFRGCLNEAMKKYGAELLGYGDPEGFMPLREHIAERMQKHGISVSADEVLITNGMQQGIDMILRLFAAPGKSIAIESPTYKELLPLIRYHNLKAVEIPVRCDGMDLAVLKEILPNEKPALIYTMPNFHNPTGITTGQAHREQLLAIAEQYRIPIVEDGFEEEMKYYGKVVLPIKSMDKKQLVIYCGTYSKVLFPGIRIGWIIAERECISRLTAIRRSGELSSGILLQGAMLEFFRKGYYDRHISKMHRAYRKRMQAAVQAIRKHISPEWVQWPEPTGGYLIWLKLKQAKGIDWQSVFKSHGVSVMHGESFFFTKSPDTYVRISISAYDEDEITEGIIRLSKALKNVYY